MKLLYSFSQNLSSFWRKTIKIIYFKNIIDKKFGDLLYIYPPTFNGVQPSFLISS